MARPKPLPPPMANCTLCGHHMQAVHLDRHERLHITVVSDSRGQTGGSPYRDESEQVRHMVICRLKRSVDEFYVDHKQFFPLAIVRASELFPPEAQVQYLPEHYHGESSPVLDSLLIIARF